MVLVILKYDVTIRQLAWWYQDDGKMFLDLFNGEGSNPMVDKYVYLKVWLEGVSYTWKNHIMFYDTHWAMVLSFSFFFLLF